MEKYFNNHRIDIVIHGSNIGGTRNSLDKTGVLKSNLRMFFNLVKVKKMYKKMIFLGSGAEYDKRYSIKNIQEKDFDKRVPIDEYGYSKYICSKFIQETENIVNLRLFGVYGKYEDMNLRFMSYAICRNILGLPIEINKNVFFDYLYITDLVNVIDLFIQKFPIEKFLNIGRGKGIDLLTIAKLVNHISEKKSDIVVKNKGLNLEYTCDNKLLLRELPKDFVFTDFESSLKELYSYYKNKKESLKISRHGLIEI